jgi:hypothetical protein
MKKLFLLCICFTVLCSCDTSNSGNAPTATPKPVPQAVLGSTLKDFEARFADGYRVQEVLSGVVYILFNTNIWDTGAPDYELHLVNGKVHKIYVQNNAHHKGAACAAFMPKDKNFVSTTFARSDPASEYVDAVSEATTIYESKWLAKQFPASAFEDHTNLTSYDQPQPLAKLSTFTFSWVYVSDIDSSCTIVIGKNTE